MTWVINNLLMITHVINCRVLKWTRKSQVTLEEAELLAAWLITAGRRGTGRHWTPQTAANHRRCRLNFLLPRDSYAKRGICCRRVFVRLSVCVCVSVTLWYCIKTAKRRITQITPHDSTLTLVFWHQSSLRNLKGIIPYGGDKCRWGGLKFVTFDEKRAITRKRYKIDA